MTAAIRRSRHSRRTPHIPSFINSIMKYFVHLILPLAIGLASGISSAADKVVVSYLPTLHSLPLYVALETRMFENAGLEVTATKFENPNQIIDSLISGRADSAPAGGAAGITALADSRFPGTLRVFGLQGSLSENGSLDDTLIVKAGSPLRTVADLKGKKLAHAPGIQWRTVTRQVVRANKLDPDKDVELVEMAIGLHAQAVLAGTVDAALTLEPFGSLVAASGKIDVILKNPAGRFVADPFFAGAGVVTTRFIKERPDVARRFIEVMDKAVAQVQKDFDGNKKYLVGYTPLTAATLSTVVPMYYLGSGDIKPVDIKAYQKLIEVFVADGAIKKPVDVSRLMLSPKELSR